jgi:hypothetical protein
MKRFYGFTAKRPFQRGKILEAAEGILDEMTSVVSLLS